MTLVARLLTRRASKSMNFVTKLIIKLEKTKDKAMKEKQQTLEHIAGLEIFVEQCDKVARFVTKILKNI